MSIWTDLLFLHGHIATTTGLAAVAPDAAGGAPPSPATATREPAPQRAPADARPVVRPRPEIRPGRISPNDLW